MALSKLSTLGTFHEQTPRKKHFALPFFVHVDVRFILDYPTLGTSKIPLELVCYPFLEVCSMLLRVSSDDCHFAHAVPLQRYNGIPCSLTKRWKPLAMCSSGCCMPQMLNLLQLDEHVAHFRPFSWPFLFTPFPFVRVGEHARPVHFEE